MTLDEARTALADAVTAAGVQCLPYPPDSVSAPLAFIDEVAVTFDLPGGYGGSFCRPGTAAASIVSVAQAHDVPGGTASLEAALGPILTNLDQLPGVRIINAASGQSQIQGQDLPALTIQVQFPI